MIGKVHDSAGGHVNYNTNNMTQYTPEHTATQTNHNYTHT